MESLKEQMYCTMCYNNFSLNSRRPKVLPCDHLVCEKCLKQVCKNVQRNFSCPECHANHPVSKYPDQKEIIAGLKEIQKKKDERKAQHKDASTQEDRALKKRSKSRDTIDVDIQDREKRNEQDSEKKTKIVDTDDELNEISFKTAKGSLATEANSFLVGEENFGY